MKYVYPDYYPRFSCTAEKCAHTCCAGWEIDIDEDTLEYYSELDSPWREKLSENIIENEDGAHFALGKDERCPFLNSSNLCDLIIGLGEDSLCSICNDHPRFRNFFNERVETGLGLCCEAAAGLILSQKTPVMLLSENITDTGCPDISEQELLALREKLICAAQNRSMPLPARIDALQEKCGYKLRDDYSSYLPFLQELECLDDQWRFMLEQAKGAHESISDIAEEFALPFENLLVYLLYRHMPSALAVNDADIYLAFCLFAFRLVMHLCASRKERAGVLRFEDIVEICRMYSSEIEYSDENIMKIVSYIQK